MIGRGMAALVAFLAVAGPAAAQEHGTGFVPLTPETYAKQPHAARARSATFLSSVDLSSYFPDPGDQKFQGSCTAWAVSYAARSYYLAALTGHKAASYSEISSPAYVFNASTSKPSTSGVLCGGATLVDALNVVKSQGVTSWQHMPYNPATCLPAPTPQDQALASSWRMPGYETIPAASLQSPDAYREMLERGKPVIIGAIINYHEWQYDIPSGPAVWTLKAGSIGSGPGFSGHAMVIVGYDDNKVAANGERGAFRLMNSWGQGWGDRGFLWISYKSLLALVKEAYVFKDAVPPEIPHDGVFAPSATQGPSLAMPVSAQVAAVSTPPAQVAPPTPAQPPAPQPVALPDLTGDLQILATNFRTGEVTVRRDGDNYRLTGYGCVDEVRYLRAVVGKYGQRVSIDMEETPWPACEIRGILKDAVARPGVDAHVVNLAPDAPPAARGVQITEDDAPVTTTAILRNGDPFEIDTEVQDQAPYVQIYYLQADQSVKEIWRGEVKPDGNGRRRLSIGGANSKIKLTASRPYGTEAVLVLAGQGVMSPATMPHNTSEAGFMDRLRGDLGQAVMTDPSIRAQIVQVEVRDNPNPADAWLITPSELEGFGGTPDIAAPAQPVVQLGDFWGPRVSVDPASLKGTSAGRLMIKAAFNQGWGSAIRPDSVRVLYRTQVGWKDVTDRVRAHGQIDAGGITSDSLALPDGRHTIRIQIQDTRGHQGMVDLNFTTGAN